MQNLLETPIWTSDKLGAPIPPSPHAVSMALPRWSDVVGYEEKSDAVVSKLSTGYPRFVIHPLVRELGKRIGRGAPCLPFPSPAAARRAADYIRRFTSEPASLAGIGSIHGVVTSPSGLAALQAFWQHTGTIVSSRQAEACLGGRFNEVNQYAPAARQSLKTQLASYYGCDAEDIFLHPTGMAAQYAALRIVSQRGIEQPTAQLGFPYVDTFKLQQRVGNGGILLHNLKSLNEDLSNLMARQPLAACFCEIPGNPLLGSADLKMVSPLLRHHRVPLVVDDTVATPYNVSLFGHADLIATSLTKYIAGTGDVMGGALICNPRSPLYKELKSIAVSQHEELLWGEDAVILDAQARGFPERMERHNRNGLVIAQRLATHPSVEKVWYPQWEFSQLYEEVRKPSGGWGALITFLPKNAPQGAPRVYDNLAVCKGPSLGTIFTIACPFTLLAHYAELEWAESCGIPRNLIRLSIGLEDVEELWRRIEKALVTAA